MKFGTENINIMTHHNSNNIGIVGMMVKSLNMYVVMLYVELAIINQIRKTIK